MEDRDEFRHLQNARPSLALDVDGPIVLFGQHPAEDVRELWIGEVPITISRSVHQILHQLHERFQIIWYTSWEKSASYDLAPKVGLPTGLPWVPLNLAQAKLGESRKFPALKRWLKSEAPLAIVDDEIGNDMVEWAASRTEPTLLVETDPRFGLEREHLERLLEFFETVAATALDVLPCPCVPR